jgi:hypothetical protein
MSEMSVYGDESTIRAIHEGVAWDILEERIPRWSTRVISFIFRWTTAVPVIQTARKDRMTITGHKKYPVKNPCHPENIFE